MDISAYNPNLDFESVLDLNRSINWTAYTSNPERLQQALVHSSLVLVFKERGSVVGQVRSISDQHTICYIQDILVHPELRRRGIGKNLVQQVLVRFSQVHRVVLMTDDEPA